MPVEQLGGKPFVIRDPVHGYIRVAAHERQVIDHPVMQRLRHVGQTGLAHFVYPAATTSRFVHSLGVMHLSSRLFAACIDNASREDLRAFIHQFVTGVSIRKFVPELQSEPQFSGRQRDLTSFLDGFLTDTYRGGLEVRAIGLRQLDSDEERTQARRWLALAEAAVRLAGLLHDLGHLPLSHDMELAIDDFASGQDARNVSEEIHALAVKKPHEAIGHAIVDATFQVLENERGQTDGRHVSLAFALARDILYEEWKARKGANAYQWLHSLVDGELDADRADYLLRDGRAFGFPFANYDLDRLISHCVLSHDTHLGWVAAVQEPAVLELESFVLARARSHQMLGRHHKIAQTKAALRFALVRVLQRTEEGHDFVAFLERVAKRAFALEAYQARRRDGSGKEPRPEQDKETAQAILNEFCRFNDHWADMMFRRLDDKARGQLAPAEDGANEDSLLQACLDLILRRRKRIISLWKRRDDLDGDSRQLLNSVVSPDIDNEQEENRAKTIADAVAERARQLERQARVLIVNHGGFRPYKEFRGKSILQVKTRGGLVAISEYSSYVAATKLDWKAALQVHAFALTEDLHDMSPDPEESLQAMRAMVFAHLTDVTAAAREGQEGDENIATEGQES